MSLKFLLWRRVFGYLEIVLGIFIIPKMSLVDYYYDTVFYFLGRDSELSFDYFLGGENLTLVLLICKIVGSTGFPAFLSLNSFRALWRSNSIE